VITLLILYVGGGVLMVAIAVPLIQKRIPPNPWYGFRVRQTLDNSNVWYPVNAYAGKCLFRSGIATSVGAIALYLVPGLNLDFYALGCLCVTFVALAISIVQSWRYLQTLDKR